MSLLLHVTDADEDLWAARFAARLNGYPLVRHGEDFDPEAVHYAFVWRPAPDAFDNLTNLKAILSLGAGVDALLTHPNLPDNVPIVRFVDEELTQSMGDYVVANVAMHHRLLTHYLQSQRAGQWSRFFPAPANALNVGVMGLGVLGKHAAKLLQGLGYNVLGWSRTEKKLPGIATHHGAEGFSAFLFECDIVVNLLPLTPQTQGILNRDLFAQLRRGVLLGGPVVINAARGGHMVEADMVAALQDGTLGAASLDVFATEPLASDSPLWDMPNCYITPHIAAVSNPDTGVDYFVKVLRDHEAGKPLPNLVDMARGY